MGLQEQPELELLAIICHLSSFSTETLMLQQNDIESTVRESL